MKPRFRLGNQLHQHLTCSLVTGSVEKVLVALYLFDKFFH